MCQRIWKVGLIGFLFLVFAPVLIASEQTREVRNLVIYQNMSLVHDHHKAFLNSGEQWLVLDGLAGSLNPSTLMLDFDGSLISMETRLGWSFWQRVAERHKGEKIDLVSSSGEVLSGTIKNVEYGRLILERKDGSLAVIPDPDRFTAVFDGKQVLPDVSGSLKARIAVDESRTYGLDVRYMMPQLTWRADYSIVIDEDKEYARVTGLATIQNRSGTALGDASVRLVAGQVASGNQHRDMHFAGEAMLRSRVEPGTVEPESFSDFYVYDMDGKHTLKDQLVYQLPLLRAEEVRYTKIYRHTARPFGQSGRDFQNAVITYEFKNEEDSGLGLPLANGSARVYLEWVKQDNITQAFAGQDQMRNIPVGESFRLVTGRSFDLVVEEWVEDTGQTGRVRNEVRYIRVKNGTEEEKSVQVEVPLRSNYRITGSSQPALEKKGDFALFEIHTGPGAYGELRLELSSL
ncbi:hypothetical protein QLX67_07130 [Balneolaceae bacterium ANBcel3]|nr:hypothetical protein [Balneolaceae bacterium ANBcel3]